MGTYIYVIDICLLELQRIVRKPELGEVVVWAETWSMPVHYGISPTLDYIRSALKDDIDKFLLAYLSVNPK